MLNLKNNENDAVFDEICKKKNNKKKAKMKIKFEGYFLDSIPWLKRHQHWYILSLIFQLFFSAKNRYNI